MKPNKVYGLSVSVDEDKLVRVTDLPEDYYGTVDYAVHEEALKGDTLSCPVHQASNVERIILKKHEDFPGKWFGKVGRFDVVFDEVDIMVYGGTEEEDLKKGDRMAVLVLDSTLAESMCQKIGAYIAGD